MTTTRTAPRPAAPAVLPLLFVKIETPSCIFGLGPCLVTKDRDTATANAAGIVYYWTSTIDGAMRYVVPVDQENEEE